MKITPARKTEQEESWPREAQPGRAIVRVYRRKTPSGNWGYMVSNYADGERRRFDSFKTEPDALEAADALYDAAQAIQCHGGRFTLSY